MKLLFVIFLFCFSFTLQAQQVSDYKYIIVPERFSDFNKNQFKLNTYLTNLLIRKDYIVLENTESLPLEIRNNPCLALTADVDKVKSMFQNKLILKFIDCNRKTIAELPGQSSIKEMERGYQEALKEAASLVYNSKPKSTEQLNVEPTINIELDEEITYANDNTRLTISELKDNSFLLINQDNSQVVAQFYPSSQNNTFHVRVLDENGEYYTIGYFDGNTIIIEYKNGANKWIPKTFSKIN